MREFTKVSASLHNSEKFRSLGRNYEAKYLYTYLLTCPHSNSSGCFDLKPAYACDDLDMDVKQYRDGIETLSKAFLISIETGKNTIFISNWLSHNPPVNQKHAIGMLAQLKTVSSDSLFRKRLAEIITILNDRGFYKDRAVAACVNTLSIRYQDGIETTTTKTSTETRDLDQTTTKTIPDLNLSVSAQSALSPPAAKRGGSAPLEEAAKRIGAL